MIETIMTSPGFGALPDASPLQIAIARAADGEPIGDVLSPLEVLRHFGVEAVPAERPTLVEIVAGVRGGKSILAACAAISGALTADLSALRPHEEPRFSIIAPTIDNATATLAHLRGIILSSPMLSELLASDPTADTLRLRRPVDGRVVELVVVAALRGGVTLRSRWSCGFVFDEVALFGAEAAGYAVNAEDLLRAGETRLVPGAQGWIISSPHGPDGLLFDLWRSHFGKPGRVLVVHAGTRALNPSFPEASIEAVRARDPDVAAREYDALWVDADAAFLEAKAIDLCTREEPAIVLPATSVRYHASSDPATRGNSWPLIVAHSERREGQLVRIVVDFARQWTGSKSSPLSPRAVLTEIAAELDPYDCRELLVDQWSSDALRDIGREVGLTLTEVRHDAEQRLRLWREIRTLFGSSQLEIPPDPVLRRDLTALRRRATGAGITVSLPRTADGRHCDYAPALALVVEAILNEERPASPRVRALIIGEHGVEGDDADEPQPLGPDEPQPGSIEYIRRYCRPVRVF